MEPIRLRRRSDNPILPPSRIPPRNLRNKAEKRCHLHAPFPPTGSISFCSNRARVRWCCFATAGRNCPIPGGTKSRRLREPASMSQHRICGVSAEPAHLPMSMRTASSIPSATWSRWLQRSAKKQAVIVGHDWGAPVAWHAALFRPDIFTAVAGLSVPPPSRGRGRPLDTLRESGITNFYWQYFQTPGVAEREFERDVDVTMRTLLGRGFSDPAASLFIEDGKGLLG